MVKVRSGFVSNSSSSSFIAEPNAKGYFQDEGYGGVYAHVGIGFTVNRKVPEISNDIFITMDGYDYDDDCCMGVIRPFSQMKDDQTLAQFKEETFALFNMYYGASMSDAILEPKLIVMGSVGNG
jgi:hypothetical protein